MLVRSTTSRWLGLFVTGCLDMVLGIAVLVLYRPVGPLVPALHSYWLIIHVSAAAAAGGAFTIGALASVLYLLRSRLEVKAIADPGAAAKGYLWRTPPAEAIDRMAYRVHAFAFPLWTFAVMAGAIWAQYAWGRYWGWDPKEVWAFITWVVYAAYLHARATAGWQGAGRRLRCAARLCHLPVQLRRHQPVRDRTALVRRACSNPDDPHPGGQGYVSVGSFGSSGGRGRRRSVRRKSASSSGATCRGRGRGAGAGTSLPLRRPKTSHMTGPTTGAKTIEGPEASRQLPNLRRVGHRDLDPAVDRQHDHQNPGQISHRRPSSRVSMTPA